MERLLHNVSYEERPKYKLKNSYSSVSLHMYLKKERQLDNTSEVLRSLDRKRQAGVGMVNQHTGAFSHVAQVTPWSS